MPRIKDLWSLRFAQVGFDSDGDIQVETDKGTLFVSRDAVVVSVWSKTIGSISEGRDLQVVADVLDELFRSMAPFRPLRFTIRFFYSLRFKQALSPLELQDDVCAIKGSKFLSQVEPSTVRSVRWTVNGRERVFMDTLEFFVGPTSVEVRQTRDSEADEFPSFREFILAAQAAAMLERLRPSIELLIGDTSKVDAGSFQE